ncbi:MAG: cyclic nucleotide-binding domain-containing protein [Tissierellales bacterium]|jgi:CRP-like cAMP-binding protein|nr:cyclic nucleotide-binding domain-containing protein [Tissierellales bacterium]
MLGRQSELDKLIEEIKEGLWCREGTCEVAAEVLNGEKTDAGSTFVKKTTENSKNVLSNSEKTRLEKLKKIGIFKCCNEGYYFFEQGTPGESMFVILKGKVSIWVKNNNKRNQYITTLRPGDFFGEMSLLEKMPRSASALAEDDCLVVEIYDRHFQDFLEMSPDFSYKMLKSLSKRLRRTNELL